MAAKPGIIFDMDGVMVHSNPTHKKAIRIFCEEYNQDVTEKFMHNRLYGRTNKEWIPELFGKMSDDKLRKLADEKEQLFRDMFSPEENIVEGITDFLDALKEQDIPMAVATSAPRENADYILSRLQMEHYFETVLDSSHVSTGKPDPEVYIKSSKALKRSPEHCIVFEDSVSGVTAGLAAGTAVVGVATTYSKHALNQCAMVIENFISISVDTISTLVN